MPAKAPALSISLAPCIAPAAEGEEAAVARARAASYEGVDFVKEVTAPEPFGWDASGTLSGRWVPLDPRQGPYRLDDLGNVFVNPPAPRRRIVAYDFGMKQNILRMLRREGFDVEVVPGTTHFLPMERPDLVRAALKRAAG